MRRLKCGGSEVGYVDEMKGRLALRLRVAALLGVVADDLDGQGHGEGQPDAEDDALQRVVLEGLAADVADQRAVDTPTDGGDAGEGGEAAQRIANRAHRQRDSRAPAGDVAGHHEDQSASLLQ